MPKTPSSLSPSTSWPLRPVFGDRADVGRVHRRAERPPLVGDQRRDAGGEARAVGRAALDQIRPRDARSRTAPTMIAAIASGYSQTIARPASSPAIAERARPPDGCSRSRQTQRERARTPAARSARARSTASRTAGSSSRRRASARSRCRCPERRGWSCARRARAARRRATARRAGPAPRVIGALSAIAARAAIVRCGYSRSSRSAGGARPTARRRRSRRAGARRARGCSAPSLAQPAYSGSVASGEARRLDGVVVAVVPGDVVRLPVPAVDLRGAAGKRLRQRHVRRLRPAGHLDDERAGAREDRERGQQAATPRRRQTRSQAAHASRIRGRHSHSVAVALILEALGARLVRQA